VDFKDCQNCYLKYIFIDETPGINNEIEQINARVVREDSLDRLAIEDAKLDRKKKQQLDFKNNCQYEVNEIDKFDGKIVKISPAYNLHNEFGQGNSGLILRLSKVGEEYLVSFETRYDVGCTSPYSNNLSFVKVKLENGDIITFYHRGDIDCYGFRLFGRLTKEEMARLVKSPIEIIRIQGTDRQYDFDDIVLRDIFQRKLRCIE
jgi:hypothetical protein